MNSCADAKETPPDEGVRAVSTPLYPARTTYKYADSDEQSAL